MGARRVEEALAVVAHAGPRRVAVEDSRGGLTYGELAASVDRLAHSLRGRPPGTRIMLLLGNTSALPIWSLACSAAGMLPILCDPRAIGPDAAPLIGQLRPVLVVAEPSDGRIAKLGGLVEREIDGALGAAVFERKPVSLQSPGESEPKQRKTRVPDAFAAICTSGSTGRVKAAVLSQRAWLESASRLADLLDLDEASRTLHAAPLAHGAGLLFAATMLRAGSNVIQPSFDVPDFVAAAAAAEATHTFLVPTMLFDLLQSASFTPSTLRTLRTIDYSGGPAAPSLVQNAARVWGPALIQDYGLIEAPAPQLALGRRDHERIAADPKAGRPTTIGRPLRPSEVSLRLPDESASVAPVGHPGVITLSGPTLMSGYLTHDGLDSSAVRDGRLVTADLAVQDDEGYVTLLGRTSNVISTGGRRVSAELIEAILRDCAGVRNAAVTGVADERWGEMVVALVVLEEVHRPTPASIDTCARSRLAPHERPKIIFDVPELPLGPTGKLRRGAVAELAARLMQTNPRP